MRARSRPRSGPQRAATLLAALLAAPAPLPAAEAAAGAGAEAESSVRIVGSRRAHRDADELLSPVDLIAGRDFARQGRSETTDMLRQLLPSYNVHAHPNSDEASTVRPAGLRGLAADQLLVLVNGRRRHRSAVISFTGSGVHDDAHGPDVGAIPAIALERLEVLRDGAAARYGSDAVAGAINFVLKDAPAGGAVETRFGQSYAGDGEERQLAASLGLPLGARGFVRLSGDWKERAATARSVQRAGAQALIDAGNAAVERPYAQVWGQPDLDDDWKGFVNLAAALGGGAELYAFGNHAARRTESGFFYRNPDYGRGIFAAVDADGRPVRLVGDRSADGRSGDCPADVYIAARLAAAPPGVADPAAHEAARRRAVAQSADCFLFTELYPGGFRPKLRGQLTDRAGTLGLRGGRTGGLRYDLAASYGESEVEFFLRDGLNAALGPATPTAFRLGANIQTEEGLSLELSRPLAVAAFASPLNVVAGLEWRREQFEIRPGEPDSWRAAGPFGAAGRSLAEQGFTVGANGFPGFGPATAGRWARSSHARYLDLEADLTPAFALGAALRWEDFSGLGAATAWQLSGRYRAHDALRLRAGWQTGYRAPTVGQRHISNLATGVVDGRPAQRGLLRGSTPVARALGSGRLRPERSDSFTIGAIMELGAAELEADYFRIAVDGRIAPSQLFELAALAPAAGAAYDPGRHVWRSQEALRADIEASGFSRDWWLSHARFYENGFDTRTRGVDLRAALPLALRAGEDSRLAFAAGWAKTRVVRRGQLDDRRVERIEKGLPRFRGRLTLTHEAARWRALARVNYHGNALEHHVARGLRLRYGAEVTLDLELGFRPAPALELALGADNAFDNRPDENPYAYAWGSRYAISAPMGTRGGFYYARARYEF